MSLSSLAMAARRACVAEEASSTLLLLGHEEIAIFTSLKLWGAQASGDQYRTDQLISTTIPKPNPSPDLILTPTSTLTASLQPNPDLSCLGLGLGLGLGSPPPPPGHP